MKKTDLAQEGLGRLMCRYALPCVVSLLVAALYNIVDQIFIANADYLGSYGNAANTVVFPATVFALAVAVMIGDGCCAFVSLCLGAKKRDDAGRAIGGAATLAGAAGIILTVIFLVFTESIITFFGAAVNEETHRLTREYYFWIVLGMPFYVFGQAMNPVIRADASPNFAMASTLAGAAANTVLDPIFIYVFRLGMMGAALATVLSQVASAVLTLRCIVGSQGMPWHIRAEKLRLHGDVFAAICTIGVPAAAQSAMYNISNMFIQSSMNSFGTSTIAAWGVYGKIDFVFWMTINSLGIAITTFAGQNFGARQYDRVRRGVRVCLAMAACTTLVISFTFYNLAEVLFRLFSQDDAVVAVGVGMMHVLTPVYITYVCIEVLAGALRGCGDVRVPTLITVFFVCVLRMLWLFIAVPIRHEVATVEMSYPITWSLASALFILYYVKGGWMQRCAEKWEKKQAG